MQLKERVGESWKCIECGVVYAPFVTECRCSVTVATNEIHLTCVHEWTEPYAPCTKCGVKIQEIQATCFHNWPEPYAPCTKCGMIMGGVRFEVSTPTVDIVGCQHIYGDNTTTGRFCTLCGTQEVLWEKPGNTCLVNELVQKVEE